MSKRVKRRMRPFPVALATGGLAVGVLAAVPNAPVLVSTPAAAAATTSFVTFNAFLKATARATYRPFVAGRSGAVPGERAFGQMRDYILGIYRGAKVEHSFVLGGSYFDCVTVGTQPTVRDLAITKIAKPPPAVPQSPTAGRPRAAGRVGRAVPSPLSQGLKDSFGNAVSCPTRTIPMRRIALEQMTRFPTVAAFLAKGPAGAGTLPQTPPSSTGHRYAVGFQNVGNHGGNSWLNLWDPEGDFTLSQVWYVGSPGTVEGGWVHYPDLFGYNSALFIYWTADNYQSTGCYNLACPAFVQVNSSIPLGASFTAYSTYGGTQWGFSLLWWYYQGNWWMSYNGTWVGYYPGWIYGSGPLASGNASWAEFGGEAVPFGSDAWPQMGSGKFASAGWAQAAFQSQIYYIGQNDNSYWSSAWPGYANPGCYTISDPIPGNGANVYLGGPGGFPGGYCF